jgi:predicted nucleic acid-binding protein
MIVVDASVIVSKYLENERFHLKARRFFQRLIKSKEIILLPEIAFPEIASAISRGTGNPQYALDFCRELRLFSNFIFIPIDESISDLSVEIASKYFLKGADAIYVAVAYRYDVPLATFDEEQKKKASKIIKVVNIS